MTEPRRSTNLAELVARAEARAAEARARGHVEPDWPEPERPTFSVIEGDDLGDAASDGRHAGADIDAIIDADELALFDAGPGRLCEKCGTPLDGRRRDATVCGSTCRVRRWRKADEGQDFDAERHAQ